MTGQKTFLWLHRERQKAVATSHCHHSHPLPLLARATPVETKIIILHGEETSDNFCAFLILQANLMPCQLWIGHQGLLEGKDSLEAYASRQMLPLSCESCPSSQKLSDAAVDSFWKLLKLPVLQCVVATIHPRSLQEIIATGAARCRQL